MFLTIFELAVFLMLPLVFILTKYENKKMYLLFIIIVYLFWYLTYSLTHELAHFITAEILHEKVLHYQLVPKFWLGQTNGGYVKILYTSEAKEFFIVLAPYIRDILLASLGFLFIARMKNNIYMKSTVFLLFISSSFFDVFNNYFAYVLGALNDFNALGYTTQKVVSHLIGILFITIIAILFYLSFRIIIKSLYGTPSEN